MFSREVLQRLLRQNCRLLEGLEEAYSLLPRTRCRRRTLCCSLLPEMTMVEALSAFRQLARMSSSLRLGVTRTLVRYFLVNPLEVPTCPFLHGTDCLIYDKRFFGCRAYGLWSRHYYEAQAACSRQAKQFSRAQWRSLGVSLPGEVVDFQVPYCSHVEVEDEVRVEDEMLVHTAETVEMLSRQIDPWHESFRHRYFSDLSFLMASLAFGTTRALQLKVSLVRQALATGDRNGIAQVTEELPDLCAGLLT